VTLPGITFRPAAEADRDWLRELKHTTFREAVERQFGWDQAWQDDYFERTFDPAKSQIVQVAGQDAGVIGVERRPGELFLADIELAPQYQGRGLGTALIRDLQRQAAADALPITLQVLLENHRARSLYERLGFITTGRSATHYLMRWDP
jgi:ribosomal protein S18 acetylase RimI-like enzyme